MSYEAKGAVVAGLAFAALRDKAWNTSRPGRSRPNMLMPLALFRMAACSGNFSMRVSTPTSRTVDGVIAHIAGSARGGDFNSRFAPAEWPRLLRGLAVFLF